MSIKVKSTKSFYNLPCAHAQYQDVNDDGSPGSCASLHGYARSVHFTFAGEVDEKGWVFPFGKLKAVREFLKYYFDHTTVLPADDPRLHEVIDNPLIQTLRVLPYGVSMEMSSLFIWKRVNAYVYEESDGRVWVEKVECREHTDNSAFIEVDEETAITHAKYGDPTLPQKSHFEFVAPHDALNRI